ncbi:hypothetical protein UT300019_29670 [Clostridium sp. CTA-19]
MKKSSRVVSTLLLGATVASASTGVFAVESKEIIKEKLAGETRFETAVEVSNKFGKADTVVLVNYTGIADALAATPLAKMKNAPILLTEAGSLTKATSDQITKLGAKKVIVIGGETAVSKNVVKQLEELKLDVERVAGEDRYATSEAVANEMGKDGKVEKVAVVNGIKGLADALSVAAPAAKEGMAIVLSDGTSVRAGQKVLDEAKTKYVIGGETVVSKELTEKLGAERLAGANRNATNAEVLNKFYDAKELDKVYVAKDGAAKENQLVDALAAGPLAGKEGNPLVLAGSELDKAQEAYLKDRIAKSLVEVGEGINQNTVSAIVKALTVKEETPSDKAEVTGVEVLNANQIEVKFSQVVDKDSAEEVGNYEVKLDEAKEGKDKIIIDKDHTGNAKAEVQADGKTVVVTLPQGYVKDETNAPKANFINQETLRVKIENVMNESKNEVFEKYENKKVKLFDNTLPELKSVKQVGPKDFDLVFSEPVTADNTSSIASAIRIDGGKYTCTAKTRIDNDVQDKKIASNVIRISTGAEVTDGEHTLTIKENKLVDYANLKLEEVDTKFEVKKVTEDLTASVYKTSNSKDGNGIVTIDFNREVENAERYDINGKEQNTNVEYYLDYENEKYKADSATMIDGKLVLSFDRELPSGEHKILVRYNKESKDKVQDLWENELATKDIKFTVAKDTVAPKAEVSYNKNDETIEVKFSKPVNDDDAKRVSNYELKDSEGKIQNIPVKELTTKKNNSLVYVIPAKNLSGKYTLTIKDNKIHDTSVEKNTVKGETFELDTLDSKAPKVTSVKFGGENDTNKVYIEFGEAMKTDGEGSITDKNLYHLIYMEEGNDEEINKNLNDIEDATIKSEDNKSVIITLPENIVGNKLEVKIGRVCDANGNFVSIDGFESSKIDTTEGNQFAAKSDKKIELINGSQIDDDDILKDDIYANKIDNKTIEVYAKGTITSVVANNITLGENNCKKVTTKPVNLKVEDGVYVKATKLTLEFDKDVVDNKNLEFGKDTITTNLNTNCDAFNFYEAYNKNLEFGSENHVIEYVDDSARIFVDKDNMAHRIEFKVTSNVKEPTIDTFKIANGYKVTGTDAVYDDEKDETLIVLELDGKSACVAENGDADIEIELVGTLYDSENNRTTDMDSFQLNTVVRKDSVEKDLAVARAAKEKAEGELAVATTAKEKAEKDLAKAKEDNDVDAEAAATTAKEKAEGEITAATTAKEKAEGEITAATTAKEKAEGNLAKATAAKDAAIKLIENLEKDLQILNKQ